MQIKSWFDWIQGRSGMRENDITLTLGVDSTEPGRDGDGVLSGGMLVSLFISWYLLLRKRSVARLTC